MSDYRASAGFEAILVAGFGRLLDHGQNPTEICPAIPLVGHLPDMAKPLRALELRLLRQDLSAR